MKKISLLLAGVLFMQIAFASDNGRTDKDPMVISTIIDAITKKPVSDVTITAIANSSKCEHTMVTDAAGQFKIAQLPSGSYSFKFEKSNYRFAEKNNVILKQESSTKLNIEISNKEAETEDYRNLFFLKYEMRK